MEVSTVYVLGLRGGGEEGLEKLEYSFKCHRKFSCYEWFHESDREDFTSARLEMTIA